MTKTIYDTDHTEPLKQSFRFPTIPQSIRELTQEPQINPNEILLSILDHVHDGNREELIGQLILMLGWLHKGGDMPNISKDTVTEDTIWIIQND